MLGGGGTEYLIDLYTVSPELLPDDLGGRVSAVRGVSGVMSPGEFGKQRILVTVYVILQSLIFCHQNYPM